MNIIQRTHTRFFKLHRNALNYCRAMEEQKHACEIVTCDDGFTVNVFCIKKG